MHPDHRRRPPLRIAAIAALVAVVLASAGFAATRVLPRLMPSAAAGSTPSAPAHGAGGPRVASPGTAPASPGRAAASRLQIPAIGVDAPVEQVGTDGAGRMATPSQPDHVAWYRLGAAPGEAGNAVIDGHLDWTNGPAVFWHLGDLKPGDAVTVVLAEGTRLAFVVDGTTEYPFDAEPQDVFTRVGPPAVALVTCTGTWDQARSTYLKRLVVHATIAPTAPSSTPGDEAG